MLRPTLHWWTRVLLWRARTQLLQWCGRLAFKCYGMSAWAVTTSLTQLPLLERSICVLLMLRPPLHWWVRIVFWRSRLQLLHWCGRLVPLCCGIVLGGPAL